MNSVRDERLQFLFMVILIVFTVFIILVSGSLWISAVLSLAAISILGVIIIGHMRSIRISSIINRLYENEKKRDFSAAPQILAGILADSTDIKSLRKKIAESISGKFKIPRFAIFFREGERYEAKVFLNINPGHLNKPKADQIRLSLKSSPENGEIIKDDIPGLILLQEKAYEEFKSPSVFFYNWGKSRSAIIISDDPENLLFESLSRDEFNSFFWPALDDLIRQYEKKQQNNLDLRRLKDDYSRSKRDLLKASKEINRRVEELNSFVDISGDLYSILDENQLFASLKDTISNQIDASKVEILHPAGKGKFVSDRLSDSPENGDESLILTDDSELYEMVLKKSKPILLPLAASGLNRDNGFLKSALERGFQILSPLDIGDEVGCFLLIGEKLRKGQYQDFELSFLSVIANIASLSLANIRQFKTIEKLSYTDSMTGIYNYRYFYKRLGEEILRAKRYNRNISLVILDIDNFKLFNDNYGHQTGDMVLKSTAELITRAIRSIDIVSRYGGEEFCIIMPDTSEDSSRFFIERIKNEIADFKFKSGAMNEEASITVSVGCSVFPHHGSTSDRLIYCADMALLKAKSLGRNKAMIYEPDFLENKTTPKEG